MKHRALQTKRHAVNKRVTAIAYGRDRLRILKVAGKIDFDPAWDHKKMRRRKK